MNDKMENYMGGSSTEGVRGEYSSNISLHPASSRLSVQADSTSNQPDKGKTSRPQKKQLFGSIISHISNLKFSYMPFSRLLILFYESTKTGVHACKVKKHFSFLNK